MQLTINGKVENLDVSTVIDVLKAKDIDPQLVAVEVNTQMIDQENLGTTSLKEDDKLEFLFLWAVVREHPVIAVHHRRHRWHAARSVEPPFSFWMCNHLRQSGIL